MVDSLVLVFYTKHIRRQEGLYFEFGTQLFKQFALTSAEGEESPSFLVAGMILDQDYNCVTPSTPRVVQLIRL